MKLAYLSFLSAFAQGAADKYSVRPLVVTDAKKVCGQDFTKVADKDTFEKFYTAVEKAITTEGCEDSFTMNRLYKDPKTFCTNSTSKSVIVEITKGHEDLVPIAVKFSSKDEKCEVKRTYLKDVDYTKCEGTAVKEEMPSLDLEDVSFAVGIGDMPEEAEAVEINCSPGDIMASYIFSDGTGSLIAAAASAAVVTMLMM